ncbi:MAG: hypothetical protein IPF60_11315, partial [Betaproteobacteria bacterium]|nr:hypothetical protein [Betaproteobacteria bacterium]
SSRCRASATAPTASSASTSTTRIGNKLKLCDALTAFFAGPMPAPANDEARPTPERLAEKVEEAKELVADALALAGPRGWAGLRRCAGPLAAGVVEDRAESAAGGDLAGCAFTPLLARCKRDSRRGQAQPRVRRHACTPATVTRDTNIPVNSDDYGDAGAANAAVARWWRSARRLDGVSPASTASAASPSSRS